MHHRARTWSQALDLIFGDFLCVEDYGPDWLQPEGTSPAFSLDRLYPEVGVAIKFHRSGTALADDAASAAQLAGFCRQAGIALIFVDGDLDAGTRSLAEIRTALSIAGRRVAQQRGALETKRTLVPRIAQARAACQQILDQGSARERARTLRSTSGLRPAAKRSSALQGILASVAAVLAFLFAILKRLLLVVVVLLVVNAAAFFVANFLQLRGPMAYNYVPDTQVPLADVIEPYPEYLRGVLRGEFGTMRSHQFSSQELSIRDVLLERLPRSLVLLGAGVVSAIVVGLGAGFLSVNRKTQRTNPLALILSLAGFSMPGFYMAILVLYVMIWAAMNYGKGLFFLPTSGYGLDRHLILPVLALAIRPTAEIARMTAEMLSDELPKDYVRVARAKGLSERTVVLGHAFRNVVAAVINAMSNSWSYLIGSLVIIETVFSWGGLGETFIQAVTFSSYAGSSFNPALVASLAAAMALLFLIADQVTGLVARALDPRLRSPRGAKA
ncbi:ABC transporter permease [Chloroflexota bacterium]